MKPLKHEQKKLPFVFTQVPLEQFPLSISHSFMSIQDMNPLLSDGWEKLSRPWICLFCCFCFFTTYDVGKQQKINARKGKREKKSKSLILFTSHSTLLYLLCKCSFFLLLLSFFFVFIVNESSAPSLPSSSFPPRYHHQCGRR